jgi:transposase
MVRNVKRYVAGGGSIRKACRALNITTKQYRDWAKIVKTLTERNPRAKSSFSGPKSILDPIKQELLSFIFVLREQGMAVSIRMVVIKALGLMREFREKTREARYHIVRRWIKHHGLVHRMGTHESQKAPSKTAKLAEDYMAVTVRPLLSQPNRSQDYILNMDQTPVPFTFNAKRTRLR